MSESQSARETRETLGQSRKQVIDREGALVTAGWGVTATHSLDRCEPAHGDRTDER